MKTLSRVDLSETLILSTCSTNADHHGPYWLYDKTRGINLAMGAETEREALVNALMYYQRKLTDAETKNTDLMNSVNSFLGQLQTKGYIEIDNGEG